MRYFVTGSNRDTGARMTLEFEAESKASAERKATQAGMSVHRVEDVTTGHVSHGPESHGRPNRRRRRSGGGAGLIARLLVLAGLAVAAYHFVWPAVRPAVRGVLRD